jgi:hypothetical protein
MKQEEAKKNLKKHRAYLNKVKTRAKYQKY